MFFGNMAAIGNALRGDSSYAKAEAQAGPSLETKD